MSAGMDIEQISCMPTVAVRLCQLPGLPIPFAPFMEFHLGNKFIVWQDGSAEASLECRRTLLPTGEQLLT